MKVTRSAVFVLALVVQFCSTPIKAEVLPEVGFWNTHLEQHNFIICANLDSQNSALAEVILLDDVNQQIKRIELALGSHQTTTLPLNVLLSPGPVKDRYGTYRLDVVTAAGGITPDVQCFTEFVRPAIGDNEKKFDYVYILPMQVARKGKTSLTLNSFNPEDAFGSAQTLRAPTLNWVSVYNYGPSKLSGKAEFYNPDGVLAAEHGFNVRELGLGQRFDFNSPRDKKWAGTLEFTPEDLNQQYVVFATRYGRSQLNTYNFAFAVPPAIPTCEKRMLTVSTMNRAWNFVEIANLGGATQRVSYTSYARDGNEFLGGQGEVSLEPYQSFHLDMNRILGSENLGVLEVSCSGSVQGAVSAQSLYYFRDQGGRERIVSAYLSPGAQRFARGSETLALLIDTYENSAFWGKFGSNSPSSAIALTLQAFLANGSRLPIDSAVVRGQASYDFAFHEQFGEGESGLAFLSLAEESDATKGVFAEGVRVIPNGANPYLLRVPSIHAARVAPTPTPTPIASRSPAPSATRSPAPSATRSPLPSVSVSPSASASRTPVPSATRSPLPSVSVSPSASASRTPVPSASISPVPSASRSPTPSATRSPAPSASRSPSPSATRTPTPSATRTPSATPTPSSRPSATPSPAAPNAFCQALPPPALGSPQITVSTSSALADAVFNAATGTTIFVAPGTYKATLHVRRSGVTIRSTTGNRQDVVIDGEYALGELVYVDNVDDVTIANITLKRAYYHLAHVVGAAKRTKFYNIAFIDGREQFVKINPSSGAGGTPSENGELACSTLEMTTQGRNFLQSNPTPGFLCYTGGIDGHTANGWRVHDNHFKNIYCTNGGLAEHCVHFWSSSRDTVVERNIFENCARGVGFGLGSSGHSGGRIENNFICASGISGTPGHDSGISLESAANVTVAHNSVYAANSGYNAAIDHRFTATSGLIVNNLFTSFLRARDGSTAVVRNNLLTTSASFTNAATCDLHLSTTGVANAGNRGEVTSITRDFDGALRDGSPDLGADEAN